jgi:hypothetical protein
MKKRTIGALLAVLPVAALAGGTSANGTIQAIQVDGGDQIVVIVGTSTWSNPDSCQSSGYVIVQGSNVWYKEMLGTVLAAQAAGKTVSFYLSGCVTLPWGVSAPIVTAVSVLT